jgi:hypothetical protein
MRPADMSLQPSVSSSLRLAQLFIDVSVFPMDGMEVLRGFIGASTIIPRCNNLMSVWYESIPKCHREIKGEKSISLFFHTIIQQFGLAFFKKHNDSVSPLRL